MTHPLNVDPYVGTGKLSGQQEEHLGTRHPGRFEPKPITISSTQMQQRTRAQLSGLNPTPQVIANNTPTVVTFATIVVDNDGLTNVGKSRFTIPSTGKITGTWQLTFNVTWAGSAAGTKRVAQVRKNGTTMVPGSTSQFSPVANIQAQAVQVLVNDPSAGDFYEVLVTQDSGGNLNLLGAADQAGYGIMQVW